MAAVVLTKDGHEGRTYELTGPEALSFLDIVAILSKTTGRDIVHVPISDADALGALLGAGVNEWWARGLVELFDVYRAGHGASVSGDVEAVTGTPPQSYLRWAEAHGFLFA